MKVWHFSTLAMMVVVVLTSSGCSTPLFKWTEAFRSTKSEATVVDRNPTKAPEPKVIEVEKIRFIRSEVPVPVPAPANKEPKVEIVESYVVYDNPEWLAFRELTDALAADTLLSVDERKKLLASLTVRKDYQAIDKIRIGWLHALVGTVTDYKHAVDYFSAVAADAGTDPALRHLAAVLRYNTSERKQLAEKLDALREMESALLRERQRANRRLPTTTP